MKLEYCRSESYNFGDDLNPWLWPKLLGDKIDDNSNVYFLGIGTILTHKRINVRLKNAEKILIFSSGAWDEGLPKLDERCQVFGVRGPRTAKKLGLSSDLAIGDGAYLLRKVALPGVKKKEGVGFIPHHSSEDFIDWQLVCDQAGVTFISPKQPVEDFLVALLGCEKVVSEAMHGAIVADALRIPWVAAKFSPAFHEEKWYDFSEAMGLHVQFSQLPFMSQYKVNMGKAVENLAKTILSKVFPCPQKWSRLPVVLSTASADDIDRLSRSLRQLAAEAVPILSDDEQVSRVTERQYQIIQEITQQA